MVDLHPNMPWPPRDQEITDALEEWAAWYSGSPTRLDAVYGGARVRPSQRAGGLIGWGARRLWGNPPRAGSVDRRIHLPLANDIATASSDLLFSEDLTIDWDPSSETMTDRQGILQSALDRVGFQSILSEAAEQAAALGGVYLRLGWDTEVADHPLISVSPADGAVPTFRYGLLTEVTFWEVLEVNANGDIIRHTETHRPGRIHHQLWVGTRESLGRAVPLTEHPTTSGLSVTAEDYVETGIDRMTAVYVPNLRPSPVWQKVPSARYLGRSDYGSPGVMGLFDAIDEAWTSWMRDIRHGKSRIIAASSVLEPIGRGGEGAYFDVDREIYEAVRMPLGENPSVDNLISAQQFAIRVEEHARTIRELTLSAVNSCGYSGSTFGLDTEVAKTATEVGAVRMRTRTTRGKKVRYWTTALEQLLAAYAELMAAHFDSRAAGEDPNVFFPPESAPSALDLSQAAQLLRSAQAASTETLVRMVNPDWDEQAVQAEVLRIQDETRVEAPLVVDSGFVPDEEIK